MALNTGSFAAMKTYFRFRDLTPAFTAADHHVQAKSGSTYEQLLKREQLIRHVIPSLMISFITLVGLGHIFQIAQSFEKTAEEAKTVSRLIMSHLVSRINALPNDTTSEERIITLKNTLANFAPQGAAYDGRILVITDDRGTILARQPDYGSPHRTLSDLLKPTQQLLQFGERAGIMDVILLEGNQEAFATSSNLSTPLGSLTLVQPKSALFEQWRSDLNLSISIYIGTTLLLFFVYYAYFNQNMRAIEADKLFHRTYAHFDAALKHGRCGIWDWDIENGGFFWSPSMFEILGLTPRESLISIDVVERLTRDQNLNMREIAQKVKGGEITHLDKNHKIRNANGDLIWVRIQGEVTYHNGDDLPRMAGICIDISEQVRLEGEKKAANNQLRDSIESLSEAFSLWDAKNRLVVCNQKYRELNQIRPESAVPGASYDEVMSGSRAPAAIYIKDDKPQKNPKRRCFETALDDGRWFQINEMRNDDGTYVTIGTDISKIKHNQEVLQKQRKKLEKYFKELNQSQEKVQKLARQNARQTEIALNANLSKADFLANISHEWRTPLNAIIGFSEMMQQGGFGPLGSEKYHEYCDDIKKSGQYMLDFINDVLDVSALTVGQFQLEKEKFNATMTVEKCLTYFQPKAKEKRISIYKNIQNEIHVCADQCAFKKMISHLISNSIKFTKENGKISVKIYQKEERLFICVADNGIGIDPKKLNEVCKPFAQVQNQFTKNHKGAGLGLAICNSLTHLHAGQMTIQSKLNEGTVVTLSLPILSKQNDPVKLEL